MNLQDITKNIRLLVGAYYLNITFASQLSGQVVELVDTLL